MELKFVHVLLVSVVVVNSIPSIIFVYNNVLLIPLLTVKHVHVIQIILLLIKDVFVIIFNLVTNV